MPHPHLMVEHDPAGYRWLRLARPQRRNALDVSLTAAIRDALAAEPSVPVLLGSADPATFCAGADLTISNAERAAVSDLIYDCCHTIITRPGPVGHGMVLSTGILWKGCIASPGFRLNAEAIPAAGSDHLPLIIRNVWAVWRATGAVPASAAGDQGSGNRDRRSPISAAAGRRAACRRGAGSTP